jgi:hypothetical protein
VRTNFTTYLKIGPQGDTHPKLVKFLNIYNVPHPTKLSKQINKGKPPSKGTREKSNQIKVQTKNSTQKCKMHKRDP